MCRAWVALKAKERWVQELLDKRARVSQRDLLANRHMDQFLLPLSSALSWLIVLVILLAWHMCQCLCCTELLYAARNSCMQHALCEPACCCCCPLLCPGSSCWWVYSLGTCAGWCMCSA